MKREGEGISSPPALLSFQGVVLLYSHAPPPFPFEAADALHGTRSTLKKESTL